MMPGDAVTRRHGPGLEASMLRNSRLRRPMPLCLTERIWLRQRLHRWVRECRRVNMPESQRSL